MTPQEQAARIASGIVTYKMEGIAAFNDDAAADEVIKCMKRHPQVRFIQKLSADDQRVVDAPLDSEVGCFVLFGLVDATRN